MAGSVRKRALPSGFEDEFVNQVDDDYYCAICKLPAKEPIQTRPCGHRFCKECMEENMRRREDNDQPLTCPVDREVLDPEQDIFVDKATKRKILSFAIKCRSEGCDWTGELRKKEDHLASCLYKLVSCTNKGCDEEMKRKSLEQHVTLMCKWSIVSCDYCHKPRPKFQMKGHFGKCSKFPVSCPNKCGQAIAREMIPNHNTKECPLALVACPYEQIGCKRKVKRWEVESHLQSDMKPHLDFACVKLKDTVDKLKDTQDVLIDTQEKLKTRVFIWKISDFREILKQAKTMIKNCIESTPFYSEKTESYGYKLKVRIYPNGCGLAKNTHLSVYIFVIKGEYDAILPWPFKKKVKLILIDQQEDPAERENATRQISGRNNPDGFKKSIEEENLGQGLGFSKFISHEEINSRRYIVDDTLFLRVEVGP